MNKAEYFKNEESVKMQEIIKTQTFEYDTEKDMNREIENFKNSTRLVKKTYEENGKWFAEYQKV